MKTIILIVLFAFSAFAQSELPIVGKIDDVKTFTKIYVAADSTKDRKLILKALKHKKAKLEVVDDPADAQFFLEFKTLSRQDKKQLIGSEYTENGEMTVYYYNADKKKVVAWSQTREYTESSGLIISKPNSYNLARKFISVLTGEDKD